MSDIDIDTLRQWVGRGSVITDTLSPRQAGLMCATLGLSPGHAGSGMPLPPLWHWIYFLEGQPASALGPDGHPARGGFLPPVPLPNRMWAGGDIVFHAVLTLGSTVEKRSCIESVEHKRGRSGELVFVTVRHELWQLGQLALTERHHIVYRERVAAGDGTGVSAGHPPPDLPEATAIGEPFTPDSTLLFRYSALTFNGHRIHYDADYCREVEGYAGLVVHGPLIATRLAAHARQTGRRALKRFRYRGLSPAVLGQPLLPHAGPGDDGGLTVWMTLPDGTVVMRAHATF
ncbi:FAS1-like dehydratase domain-containing protein [Leptothrix sp. BB-4]